MPLASVLTEVDAAAYTVPCTVAAAVAAVVVIVVVDDDVEAVAVLEVPLEPKEEAPEETMEPVKVPSEMSDEPMRNLRRLNFPLACMERLRCLPTLASVPHLGCLGRSS